MKPSQVTNNFYPGPEKQMISISKDYPCIQLRFKPFKPNPFDSALRPNRHENGSCDLRPSRSQNPGPRLAVLRDQFPIDWFHMNTCPEETMAELQMWNFDVDRNYHRRQKGN